MWTETRKYDITFGLTYMSVVSSNLSQYFSVTDYKKQPRKLWWEACFCLPVIHIVTRNTHIVCVSLSHIQKHIDWLDRCMAYTTHLMKHSGVPNHDHTYKISQTNSDSWFNQTNKVSPVTCAWILTVYLNWPTHTSWFHGNLWQLSYINASNMSVKCAHWT